MMEALDINEIFITQFDMNCTSSYTEGEVLQLLCSVENIKHKDLIKDV